MILLYYPSRSPLIHTEFNWSQLIAISTVDLSQNLQKTDYLVILEDKLHRKYMYILCIIGKPYWFNIVLSTTTICLLFIKLYDTFQIHLSFATDRIFYYLFWFFFFKIFKCNTKTIFERCVSEVTSHYKILIKNFFRYRQKIKMCERVFMASKLQLYGL